MQKQFYSYKIYIGQSKADTFTKITFSKTYNEQKFKNN
ncbi:hypothetical protein Mucpa_0266 [Mucilaginibacter paludis DSM 18603]|uniref:Uncharacterized protein n=1 Tax=Mucilaginibacter paludis DSM 18603 TaxID=714943 RepID=H1YFR1_9SPHI|nr:hypothetical protein Mucpa_0266 [Mucilaginibacter paludis DSM 18603]